MFGIDREMVEHYKARYPQGTRVRCNYMNDPYGVPSGTMGTVRCVDDMGTVHVNWDNGSSLGACLGEDSISIVNE